MTHEQQIRLIAAETMGVPVSEVSDDTQITDWRHMTIINDETCIALQINISASDAAQCRTVGDYIALVRGKR
ncbi:hypothetical protein D8I35_05565 [Corticibacter populi]|uniref:Acyl carrier protein n=2 Tax=Corticibacter populi TaxID=1550736 RepID=A0A3M6QZU6_9BURK|nr:hypothetical protein D8I35_05565 [Corticibacter populi]